MPFSSRYALEAHYARKIVEKNSAILGLPDSREKAIALNAHHEEICKFVSEEDENYKHVSASIVDFVQSAIMPQKKPSLVETFNSLDTTLVDDWVEPRFCRLIKDKSYGPTNNSFLTVMIPYPRNKNFINRKPIIQQLRDLITPIGETHSRVALFGLGGVGFVWSPNYLISRLLIVSSRKSQVAIELAYQIHNESPQVSVFWIHASSIDRFRECCCNIADECDIPGGNGEKCDKMSLFKKWLEKEPREWLLIVDNADEASLFTPKGELSQNKSKAGAEPSILEYLPESPRGSILITTRNRAAGVRFTKSRATDLVEVQTMTEEESSCLIKSTLTDHIPTDSETHELAGLLCHLPLALAQAAAFMQENILTVNEYIELYKDSDETQMDLLSEPFVTLGRDSAVHNAVVTTFIVSINQIKERDPKAIEILCLVAFVDQHDVPKSLIQGKLKRPLELTKALGTLKSFSLITTNERGNFSLHRLVQLVMRKWLIIEEKFENQAIQAMDIVAGLFPNATFEQWSTCAAYLPHAQSILNFVPELHDKLLRRRLYLQEGIAYYLWTQGYYDEGEKLDLLIVEENKKEFGMEHPETLESIAGLAATYENHGKWAEAAKLDEHVFETRAKNLGPTHSLTLTSKIVLAKSYNKQGRTNEAESLMLEVLETSQSLFGEEHESTIDTMANLGSIYIDTGQLEQADELITQVFDWRRNTYGTEHIHTLDTATTLGVLYIEQDELQAAEELIIQTIEVQERKLGSKHPDALTSKSNLATVYQSKQEWERAEELALDVIKDYSTRLGSTHYDTLKAKLKLVDIWFHRGLMEQSDELEDKVMNDSDRSLGSDHPFTLECIHEVALTQRRQCRDKEAVELMRKVVSRREKVLGPFHDETLMSFEILCDWCGQDEAIEMLLDAEEKL